MNINSYVKAIHRALYSIMNKLMLKQQGSKSKRYLRKLKNQIRCYEKAENERYRTELHSNLPWHIRNQALSILRKLNDLLNWSYLRKM